MGESIGFIELLKLVKNRWYVVLIGSIVGFGLAYGVSTMLIPPQYASSTNLLVSRPQTGNERLELGEIQTNIQMINTYRDVIEDPVVLDKVMLTLDNRLSQEELIEKINVNIQSDSQIFGIEVVDSNPERAALIANAVATAFKESIVDIMNVEDVVILSPAVAKHKSISPNVLFYGVIGTLAGMVLSLALILIGTMADTRVHGEEFISDVLEWNRLGTVTSMEKADKTPLQKDISEKSLTIRNAESHPNGQ